MKPTKYTAAFCIILPFLIASCDIDVSDSSLEDTDSKTAQEIDTASSDNGESDAITAGVPAEADSTVNDSSDPHRR